MFQGFSSVIPWRHHIGQNDQAAVLCQCFRVRARLQGVAVERKVMPIQAFTDNEHDVR